ncbi:serine carboxypeptidase S28 [Colletotrichum costaricense]|uniref:Serine carboxypeptidase S28 n=1 Tax=Colletotrichum costaricense TaxID=1209916 RepID=A0AAI9YT64_9PEZI|nr:serine carboxypeptidase S28 [Colletotrichum costaricense]KAK1522032.1 serine carboxypeptidase S28 [Colletotrichum costaricense]
MKASIFASAVAFAATVMASIPTPQLKAPQLSQFPKMGGLQRRAHSGTQVHNGTFDQYLDHTDLSKGTFKQRYWYNSEHWGGPGYPVFMLNGGEGDAEGLTGYLENGTLTYLYAETYKGAIVLMEHRYYGKSLPFKTFTADTLQYLNVPQAIYDNTHFAETVELPFDKKKGANADKSPWVLIGGSYPGALSAWTSVIAPGTFAAYHASSAVVQAIDDFWQFFTPIEQALPRACSADVKLVIKQVDSVLDKGSAKEIDAMKEEFGLETLEDNADFAWYLLRPIIEWASNETAVYEFCDYIETSTNNGNIIKGTEKSGVGLKAAWKGYTSYMYSRYSKVCEGEEACDLYGKAVGYNRPNDLSADRSWTWQLCNEPFGWWHVGPPKSDGTNIVSSHVRPADRQRQCDLRFPQTFGFKPASSEGFTAAMFNDWTGGWNATFENVLFCDGEHDGWRSASMNSDYRPGGPVKTTEQTATFVVKGANHVPDFLLNNGEDNAGIIEQEVKVIGKWIKAWKPNKSS